MKRVTKIEELIALGPELLRLHKECKGCWQPDDSADFMQSVYKYFLGSYIFVEHEGDNVSAFFYFYPMEAQHLHAWLAYVHPSIREKTKSYIAEMRKIVKADGYKTVSSATTRNHKSYKRWVSKFGLSFQYTVYKGDL